MTIAKETFMKDIFKLETPITFVSLHNFNLNSEVSITSKDILDKIQEMMFTGEWFELYNHAKTEEMINDLHSLGLVKWPKCYVVYNIEKGSIEIAEDTTRLNELLNNGYYVFSTYKDFEDNYYKDFVECAKQHIPYLYQLALIKSKQTSKDLGESIIDVLNETTPNT